jgi:hypothetical protein
VTQFKRKASGPLGPEGYRAAARKLRRFAETLDSRADGPPATLTPIIRDIEAHARSLAIRHQEALVAQHAVRITIPDDLDYADLKLSRDVVTGGVDFDWAPIERICEASGLDVALFRDAPEDNLSALLVAWYTEHLARGGAPDAVQEQILAEVEAEDTLGAHRVQIGSGRPQ